ncbi:MAG: PHP domain-containing protein [Acutalibacteraceae bacterium]
MFKLEKTYDIDEIVRNNMHTHTFFSRCARPEMTLRAMIAEAEKAGLQTLAVTDHSDLDDNIDTYANTVILRTQLSGIDTPVRVLIGSELSAYGVGKYSETEEMCRSLDYRSYSHSHYHLDYWEQPEDRSARGYAKHMLAVLDALLDTDRADSIAHPFSPEKMDFFNEAEKAAVLAALTDNELGDILAKGERAGCVWELHAPTFFGFPTFSKRFFHIGKEVGVHFSFGTDAHTLDGISTAGYAERMKKIL